MPWYMHQVCVDNRAMLQACTERSAGTAELQAAGLYTCVYGAILLSLHVLHQALHLLLCAGMKLSWRQPAPTTERCWRMWARLHH